MAFPSKIHAITIAKNGGPEVIEKTLIPFSKVEPGHVVVKTDYFGINFVDTYFREGHFPASRFPYVLGREAAGVIVGLPTDPTILNNPEYQKRGYKEGGKVVVATEGAHAEYLSASWTDVHPIPDAVSPLDAVAIFLQGLGAIVFMEEAYDVQRGDVVLIHTVCGGLGLLLCQYAKHCGATVIGTTSTQEKAVIAKQHGADHVIIYKEENTIQRVLEITNGEGVHAAFDGVGKDTWDSNFEMVRRKGTIVSYGNASGPVPSLSPLKLTAKNLKFLRPAMANYIITPDEKFHYVNKLWSLVGSGALKPTVRCGYPFTADGARQAHIDLVCGKTVGNVVLSAGISD